MSRFGFMSRGFGFSSKLGCEEKVDSVTSTSGWGLDRVSLESRHFRGFRYVGVGVSRRIEEELAKTSPVFVTHIVRFHLTHTAL